MTESRIAPASPPFSDDIQRQLDAIMPPGVPPLLLFRVLARDARLFERFMAGGLLDKGHLSLRQRELAILRTCARCGSEYEWGVHVTAFSARAGLSEQEARAAATRSGLGPTWAPDERAIIELMDELHDTSTLCQRSFDALRQHFDEEQLLELILLAGYYHTVAFITNGLALSRESFAASFPAAD